MWYNSLPSGVVLLGLMTGAGVVPPIVAWVFNFKNRQYTPRYFHGDKQDYMMYVRDMYKFGSLYKPQGLEALDNVDE